MARADEDRRLGIDLLFSSNQDDWETARKHLEAASMSYQEIGRAAEIVRDALALRDEVLPLLPGYTRWVARWSRDGDHLAETGEALWSDARSPPCARDRCTRSFLRSAPNPLRRPTNLTRSASKRA